MKKRSREYRLAQQRRAEKRERSKAKRRVRFESGNTGSGLTIAPVVQPTGDLSPRAAALASAMFSAMMKRTRGTRG